MSGPELSEYEVLVSVRSVLSVDDAAVDSTYCEAIVVSAPGDWEVITAEVVVLWVGSRAFEDSVSALHDDEAVESVEALSIVTVFVKYWTG